MFTVFNRKKADQAIKHIINFNNHTTVTNFM